MKQIRESKLSKVIAYYLIIMMCLQVTQPMQMYALTSGPTQPEFNSFTPIGTSDMVDLSSGDFNYNIPIMDVGGYPINLSYNPGITMDQEASWVGLGWNMNVGQIERQVRGLPDDFRGDEMRYENSLKDNITVGTNVQFNAAFGGFDAIRAGFGMGVEYNNYEGVSFKPSFGVGFKLSDNVTVGMNLTGSVADGASVSPSVSISAKMTEKYTSTTTSEGLKGTGTIGLGFNSRKGVENINLSASANRYSKSFSHNSKFQQTNIVEKDGRGGGMGGSISFNNQSFTPSKRVGYDNLNFSFNAAIGSEIWLIEPQVQMTGYGSYQGISNAYRDYKEKAFGYENTEYKKSQSGVLDFNRENEKVVSENTTALPLTNYTYDTYNIQGQGVSGMFRPYRSKVSYLYNDAVVDSGFGLSAGVEFGAGGLVHAGVDFKVSPSTSHTGGWFNNNNVLPYFSEKDTDYKDLKYEPTTFKLVGSMVVDPEEAIYYDEIHDTKALRLNIGGKSKNRTTTADYQTNTESFHFSSDIKRTKRFLRNQLVQKITNDEATGDKFIEKNFYALKHHTAGIKVTQTDGSRYVYGQTVYNNKKVESTFDVSGKGGTDVNVTNGTVLYNAGSLSGNNSNNSDKFINRITTPAYAHSYLLTSVLSSDYEDVDDNGISINDLGSYTKFEYADPIRDFKWRIPYEPNTATYNEGLISHKDDQKGNYLYGIKEVVYLKRIVTKSHVAFFDLEDRKDAFESAGEHGDRGSKTMKKIKSIRLYSLPEVTNATTGAIVDPGADGAIKPIKTAHFIYSYKLCKNIPNNANSTSLTDNEIANEGGKLTLEKVYFTYRGSNMGKYTPYVFNYSSDNPNYSMKGFDIWGNYKESISGSGNSAQDGSQLSTTEFPFVKQNAADAAKNTGVWTLKTIDLPSGGKITIETESDDYQYVQNRKAMQMFMVTGAGNTATPSGSQLTSNTLYEGNTQNRYLYVKVSDSTVANLTRQSVIDNYLKDNYSKPIQFRFLLNMTDKSWQYDYVSGYFEIGETKANPVLQTVAHQINVVQNNAFGAIIAIPVKYLKRDGGINGKGAVNPIAKAGWGFGRTYLNRAVYSLGGETNNTNFGSIVRDLVGSFRSMGEIFKGPNKVLQDKGCARTFKNNKSWIRLENPDGKKLGGGIRVKSIKLSDEWSTMLSGVGGTTVNYGQQYSYDNGKGQSSGVATFEPNSCSENALIEPFYAKTGDYADRIAAPRENNYEEEPFGENFFPAARVTYSMVTVRNLDRKEDNREVKKHATGRVVTEHFTTFDFPTKVDYTNPKVEPDIVDGKSILGALASLASIRIRNHLTMTQGYSIITNDMNGKIKSEKVYAVAKSEGNDKPISSVEYKYNIDNKGGLDSNLTTIDEKGKVAKRLLGLDYDMINDFNESKSATTVVGFDGNLAAFLIAIFPAFVPTILPKLSYHENQLRTAVTTKHIHQTGILTEKIATDLGATVSTKNLAWDASSGEVILTETINEYNDNYYSFNYPAYWMYGGMGLASQNIGIEGILKPLATGPGTVLASNTNVSGNPYFRIDNQNDLSKIFHFGDELYVPDGITQASEVLFQNLPTENKVWVVGFNSDKSGVLLMDRNGVYVNKCFDVNSFKFKITRSGYRNMQMASMASVTSMINPIKDINLEDTNTSNDVLNTNIFKFAGSSAFNPRIINANAVVYKDFWNTQLESVLPYYPSFDGAIGATNFIQASGDVKYPYDVKVNPYVWNIKGDWKAEKSYAYLTGRNAAVGNVNNPRNEGFFTSFSPFYQYIGGAWNIADANWTYASSISKVSPYGAELENKDALGRYSAALYGYQYKLPMAVASNSKYTQMGYEGFEEKNTETPKKHFGFEMSRNNISSQQSHTGKNSVKVSKGQITTLSRSLRPSNRNIVAAKCGTVNVDCFLCDLNFGSCSVCPVRFNFIMTEPNSLVLPFCIPLIDLPNTYFSYTGIRYCLQYPNNGGSAVFVGNNRIDITPTTNTQIMYLTIDLTVPYFYHTDGSQTNKVYVKITFNADRTWTHECINPQVVPVEFTGCL